MNPEIKQKWITALRSGEYKQGKNVLRSNDDCYCCLGVLCDVYIKETGKGEWRKTTLTSEYYFITTAQSSNTFALTNEVAEWAGLKGRNPELDAKSRYSCSAFNDGTANLSARSFSQIADLIENNL